MQKRLVLKTSRNQMRLLLPLGIERKFPSERFLTPDFSSFSFCCCCSCYRHRLHFRCSCCCFSKLSLQHNIQSKTTKRLRCTVWYLQPAILPTTSLSLQRLDPLISLDFQRHRFRFLRRPGCW